MLGTGSNRFVEISKLLFGSFDFFPVFVCVITDQGLNVLQASLHRFLVLFNCGFVVLRIFQIFCMFVCRLAYELLEIIHTLL